MTLDVPPQSVARSVPMTKTLKQQLAESLYEGDLAADVAVMLADGKSYREAETTINLKMPAGFFLSREALRRYYPKVPATVPPSP
jgi:hypothetical protein